MLLQRGCVLPAQKDAVVGKPPLVELLRPVFGRVGAASEVHERELAADPQRTHHGGEGRAPARDHAEAVGARDQVERAAWRESRKRLVVDVAHEECDLVREAEPVDPLLGDGEQLRREVKQPQPRAALPHMAEHVLEVARGAAPDRQPRGGAPLPRQPEPHQPLAPRQQRLAETVVAGSLLAVKGGDVLARAQGVAGELEADGGVVNERVGGGVAGALAEEAAEASRLRRVRDRGGVGRVRTGNPLAQVPADAVLLRDEGRPQLREHR
mmetsp:Transcript_40680/g.131716  ORF Transcript_40680/g.131716 Transcript_40680/m.131716 type:complete len:268 (-) Transcript_40680:227-1030(-)